MITRCVHLSAVHVASHPVLGHTVWPRGKLVFGDYRFLVLCVVVLGSSTLAFYTTGGSLLGAIIPHWFAVVVWKEFYGGEKALFGGGIGTGGSGEG